MKLAPLAAAGALAAATPAFAVDLRVDIEIPRLAGAEYHAPYVAVWIERPADQSAVAALAVWYDVDQRNNEGLTWLVDMRTWWRKIGRTMTLPADGVSGPTRAPGRHSVAFRADHAALSALPAGEYNIVVEAARELGGREVVRVPLVWNGQAHGAGAQGSSELGAVSVAVTR